MKKLFTILFGIVLAAGVQAASIQWNVVFKSWKMADGSTFAPAETTVYLVNAADTNAVLATVYNKDGRVDESAAVIFGKAQTGDNGLVSVTTTTSDKLANNTSYKFAYMVVDTTTAGGPWVMISKAVEQYTYDASATPLTPTSVSFGGQEAGANALLPWTNNIPDAVPEPMTLALIALGAVALISFVTMRRRAAKA